MKFSDLKKINELANDLNIDFKELANGLINETDFEVDNYHFIDADEIDSIQEDELKSDTYILGCFNADFLADIINVPHKAIVALQKAECYSELGEICLDYVEEIQQEYARLDGYGHHFAHYDHNENEFRINGKMFYYFRTN